MRDEFESTRIADSVIWQVYKFAVLCAAVGNDPDDREGSIKAAEEWIEGITFDLNEWLERAKKAGEATASTHETTPP